MDVSDSDAREALVLAAQREWRRPVVAGTSEGNQRITQYMHACNWGWALKSAGVETYSEAARRDNPGTLDYCGIFAYWCLTQVGDFLVEDRCVWAKPDPQLKKIFPSTRRFAHPGEREYTGAPLEQVDVSDIRRGDIAVITTDAHRTPHPYGNHIVIVEETYPDGTFYTVEGNAYGQTGTGKDRGVVVKRRSLGDVRRAYRVGRDHIELGGK